MSFREIRKDSRRPVIILLLLLCSRYPSVFYSQWKLGNTHCITLLTPDNSRRWQPTIHEYIQNDIFL